MPTISHRGRRYAAAGCGRATGAAGGEL